MDRCAVLVDAGYLLAASATLVTKNRSREGVRVDYEGLVQALREEAESRTGMPVLRILWYDAAFEARSSVEHQMLAALPDVKVRLGVLVRRGDALEQKGVDSYLHRDLTTLSRNRAVEDIVLVGGDEDLRRAVDESQEYGVRVQLWGIEAAAPEFNQARTLIAEADRRWVIDQDWVERFVQPKQPEPVATTEGTAPASGILPSDFKALAESAAAGHLSSLGHPGHLGEMPGADVVRLEAVSTPQQKAQDAEEDTVLPLSDPGEMGRRFGKRWAARAPRGVVAEAATASYPPVPAALDPELMRWAGRTFGIDTWDEAVKVALRGGARAAIDEAAVALEENSVAKSPDASAGES